MVAKIVRDKPAGAEAGKGSLAQSADGAKKFAFRKHTRSKTRKRVQMLSQTTEDFLAVTNDISASGISIEKRNLPRRIKVGETFTINFPHRQSAGEARVVRDNATTIGLRFV